MAKASIWLVEGRMERLGIKVSYSRLTFLKNKRTRQLGRLAEKYRKINPKKAARFESRMAN